MIVPSLLITLSLALSTAQARGPKVTEGQAERLFAQENLTYCDAQVLGAHWGVPAWDAKVRAGRALARGGAQRLDRDLAPARAAATLTPPDGCTWITAGYTPEDLSLLATAWQTDTAEAKARVASKVAGGHSDWIQGTLEQAWRADEHSLEGDVARAFSLSAYTLCDARLLAQAWQQPLTAAKADLGRKAMALLHNEQIPAIQWLYDASRRGTARCSLEDANLSATDLPPLMNRWGLSEADARERAEAMLSTGQQATLTALITGQPEIPRSRDSQDAFFASDLTYCDASIVAAAWHTSPGEAKARLGDKLIAGGDASGAVDLLRGRAISSGHRCWPDQSGFTPELVTAFAGASGQSFSDAKASIETKLLAGTSQTALEWIREADNGVSDDVGSNPDDFDPSTMTREPRNPSSRP